VFDMLALLDKYVLHTSDHSFLKSLLHGGSTATANFNVTAALATVTFFAVIIAGSVANGFIQHWKNLVPHGLALPLYFLLVPLEIIGMLVRPFALTMRLAANMAGGHIAILAILSFVFIFTELTASTLVGAGIGFGFSLPWPSRSPVLRSSSSSCRRTCSLCCRPCLSAWPFTRTTNQRSLLRRRIGIMETATYAPVWHYMGAAIGFGLTVLGAGLGIGKLAAAAAEGVARQPSAASQITAAANLPLFLLEGATILALVFGLLIVFLK